MVEKETFFLQLKDVWRHHELVVALKVAPSGIVGHNEDDVGGRPALGVAEAGDKEQSEQRAAWE